MAFVLLIVREFLRPGTGGLRYLHTALRLRVLAPWR